jgi:hypothetical protein
VRWAAILLVVGLWTSATAARAGEADGTVTVYTRAGCPHCAEANEFLDQLAR